MALTVLRRPLKQSCIYWPPAGRAWNEFGRPLSASPEEILCRWEDTAEEYVDAQGTTRVSSARVLVGQDLAIGGFLVLGSLDDLDSGDGPEDVGALEIRSFQKMPDMRAKNFLRVAVL